MHSCVLRALQRSFKGQLILILLGARWPPLPYPQTYPLLVTEVCSRPHIRSTVHWEVWTA